ncbi:PH domain-containing protein [Agromyces kandeliae]|uniref:PH domain-containing protein n=1 Tax=Agromyces kandeliae TaxID=2666141 RepID=UPI002D21A78F|nr:PH domain-containing protein [Agromyces kandeliae]
MTADARSIFDPRVERFLIADEGEVVVDEVAKHWAAIVKPVLGLVASVPLLLLAFVVPPQAWWLPAVLAIGLACYCLWRILQAQMDRFVITNMRVFRVHGILTQNIATMPLSRILDISVHRPVLGRIFGFGHIVFESAAQRQGLNEIRYVGSPNERDLTIQRVIARAGLRGPVNRATGVPLGGGPGAAGGGSQASSATGSAPRVAPATSERADGLGPNDTVPIERI